MSDILSHEPHTDAFQVLPPVLTAVIAVPYETFANELFFPPSCPMSESDGMRL
jgi:hypothetical protein